MTGKASFRNIDAVKSWFLQAKKPFWSVFTGFSKDAKDLAMKNSTIDDVEQSWELLEEIITNKTEGGGRVTIYITEVKNSSHGYTEYLEIAATNQAAVSGAAHIGNQNPFFGIGGIQEYIDSKILIADKDRQIKDLQDALEEKEKGTGIGKLWNKILDEAPLQELMMAIAAKVLGPAAFAPPINGPRITDDAESNVEELSEADQEKLHNAILRISAVFPNVVEVMSNLADFIEKNPAMAKSFLNQMK